MSFFGLTAFGPENIIKSNLINSNCFTLFSEDEYFKSFEKLKNSNNTISVSDIHILMQMTFGFKPLDDEISLFKNTAAKENHEFYTWDDIVNTLTIIKNELNNKADQSKKFNSYEKFYYERYKYIRKDESPNDLFKQPISYGQEYGFHKFKERNLNYTHLPKKKCEETKFAEAIILTGKHFMK